jgi:hypothetical protein
VAELPRTFFSLEGQTDRLQLIERLLGRMGNPYFTISAHHKSLYHLSACILSNYLVTLMDAGLSALEHSGIDPRQGFQAMRPLIEGTLANIAEMGTARALTGPIARGDSGTIRTHLESLDSHGSGGDQVAVHLHGCPDPASGGQKYPSISRKSGRSPQLAGLTAERKPLWLEKNLRSNPLNPQSQKVNASAC